MDARATQKLQGVFSFNNVMNRLEELNEMVDGFDLSKNQSKFLHSAFNGNSIFLTGKAGTGKTFVVKKTIEILSKFKDKKILIVAPTGIAANNVGGSTIHSTFSLSPFGMLSFEKCNFLSMEKRAILKMADVIIIDEVSMLRTDILDAMNWTMLKNGCGSLAKKQLIFIGDMKQLGAPVDDNMRSVILQNYENVDFTNSNLYSELKVEEIELDKVLRQNDAEFIENLNIIRDGGKSEYFRKFVSENPRGIILAPHNNTVENYNRKGLDSIEGKTYTYHAIVSGKVNKNSFNVPEKIEVKDGSKIMYLINSKRNDLFNGAIGIFRMSNGTPRIEINGVQFEIETTEFLSKEYALNEKKTGFDLITVGSVKQLPIKLAYALTIHKSQGLTLDEVTLDLTRPCFAEGQMYVALSRVKTPEGLTILI